MTNEKFFKILQLIFREIEYQLKQNHIKDFHKVYYNYRDNIKNIYNNSITNSYLIIELICNTIILYCYLCYGNKLTNKNLLEIFNAWKNKNLKLFKAKNDEYVQIFAKEPVTNIFNNFYTPRDKYELLISPAQTLTGYLLKHIISVLDICEYIKDDIENNQSIFEFFLKYKKIIDEKFNDTFVYSLIMCGINNEY